MCPSSLNDDNYTIRCDNVSGCSFSGCSYNLSSMIDTISGRLERNNSTKIRSNKVRQKTYHLTVRNLKEVIVQSENITFNYNLWPTTTGQKYSKYHIGAKTFTPEGPSESDYHEFSLSGSSYGANKGMEPYVR